MTTEDRHHLIAAPLQDFQASAIPIPAASNHETLVQYFRLTKWDQWNMTKEDDWCLFRLPEVFTQPARARRGHSVGCVGGPTIVYRDELDPSTHESVTDPIMSEYFTVSQLMMPVPFGLNYLVVANHWEVIVLECGYQLLCIEQVGPQGRKATSMDDVSKSNNKFNLGQVTQEVEAADDGLRLLIRSLIPFDSRCGDQVQIIDDGKTKQQLLG